MQRPDLKYPIFTPGLPRRVAGSTDLLAVIRQKDVLLHHPFHSFGPVLDFLRGAAADPRVLAIKQTLYRTGNESPIVDALVTAAQSGKDVTVIVELRARFDEEANIELSNRLQEAGAHVMYGVVGFKTHCKMSMVVRRESEGLRRYCHLGTGNYHPRTARGYTDYSLFTCDPEIGQDVHELFLQLTSLTQTPRLTKLLQSPFGLHDAVVEKIDREAELASDGKPGRIIAKMNSLVDPQVIEALYRASRAGVQIDLIIRGLCALRPGIPGVSENIRVRSIVGRFLEHSRVFFFGNDGRQRAVPGERRLDGTQFLPSRGNRLPGARSRPIASASCAISIPTCPTTLRPGRSDAMHDIRVANAATRWRATPRDLCLRVMPPAARQSSSPEGTIAYLRGKYPQPESDTPQILDLLLKIRDRERVIVEPFRRKAHFQ